MENPNLKLAVLDADGNEKAVSEGSEVKLVYRSAYQEGDRIALTTDRDTYLWMELDDAIGRVLVLMKKPGMTYELPSEWARRAYSPKAFSGTCHLLWARPAEDWEIRQYRNLAVNPYDQHENGGCYPHALANVETRNDPVFFARNIITGDFANDLHGQWPYLSWGIDRNPKASITVQLGRLVKADKLVIYIRADFPHDNWWTSARITLSDGSILTMPLEKTAHGQVLELEGRIIDSVTIDELIPSDDPSPFPALSQLELYGTEIVETA